MKTPQIAIAFVVGLLLLGGGFAAGMSVGKGAEAASASASPSGAGGRGFVTGQAPGGGGAARGAAGAAGGQQLLTGRVLSVNDGSITIEVRTGGGQGASPTVTSEIVLVGSSTRIVKTTETDIKATDLKANDQIQIIGTTDATGSVSASAIVVGGNALQQLFGGGAGGAPGGAGGRGASPSPSPTK